MLVEKRVLETVSEYAQYILKKLQENADRYCIVMLFNGKEMHKLKIQMTKNAALLSNTNPSDRKTLKAFAKHSQGDTEDMRKSLSRY